MSSRKIANIGVRKIIIFLCLIPLILLTLGFFYVAQLQYVLYGSIQQAMQNRSMHVADVGIERIESVIVSLQKIASRSYIYSESVNINTKLAILFGEMEKTVWHDMLVVDTKGHAVSVKEKKYVVQGHAYYAKALQGQPSLSSIIAMEDGTMHYVAHAVPIYKNGKVAEGVVGVLVGIENAIEPQFSHGESGKSHNGDDIFLVDRQGKYVDYSKVMDVSVYSQMQPLRPDFLAEVCGKIFGKMQNFRTPVLFQGVESFVVEVPMGGTGWHVLSIMPRDYSVRQMEELWYFSIIFVGIVLALLFFCIVYLLRMNKVFARYKNVSGAIMHSQRIFYLDIDCKGMVHYANEYFCQNAGWSPTKQSVSLLPLLSGHTEESLCALLEGHKSFVLNLTPKGQDAFEMHCTAMPHAEKKNVWLILGVDVTLQKNALEMQLATQQKAELQQIINSLPHGLMVHSADGLRLVNQATLEILHLENIQDIREFIKHSMGLEFFEKQMQMVGRTLHNGSTENSIFEFTDTQGKKFIFRNIVSPVYDENGQIKYAVNIALDITENVKLQRQLEDEVQRMHEILDNSPSGFMYSSDHIIRYCNAAMYKMGKDIHVGQPLPMKAMGVEDIGKEIVEKVSNGINVYDILVDMVGADDVVRKLSISVIGVTWFGKWHNMLWAHDVTAIHAVQKELMVAKEAAEQAARAKSDFLATMSHEIRTPMNAVLGFLHVFDKSNLSATQLNYIEKITISAKGLLRIINDILDFSKIEANKMALEHVPFNLYTNIDAVYSITCFSAKEKGLAFYRSIDEDVPQIMVGDGERLNQVLLNLLSNAIKFTSQGHVDLRVRVKEKLDEVNYIIECSVSDTGIGLSQEQAEALFQPFTQADTSTSRKFGGTGLGLAISKRILQLMEGDITLQSTLGQGSTFTCTLPMKVASQSMLQESVNVASHAQLKQTGQNFNHLRGKKILVVEDNLINQEIAAAMMEEYHLDIQFANNGQEAVAMVQKEIYELIFMDLQMPVMNGLDAAKAIRKLDMPYLKNIPIVAMTANVMHEDRQACEEAGMNDHIGKPISPQVLRRTLEQYLLGNVD